MMLKIRAERKRRGWSQTKLAARAEVSTSDVSRIESGRFVPYDGQRARLARALKLDPNELLEAVDAGK